MNYLAYAVIAVAAFNLGAVFSFWWTACFRPLPIRKDDDDITGIGA